MGIHLLVKRGPEFKQDVARHGTLELGVGPVDEHGTKQGHHGPGNPMSGAVDEGQGAPSAFFCEKQEITTENVTGPVNEQGFRKKLLKFFFSRQGHFKDGLGADDPLGDVDEVLANLVRQPLPLISLGLQLGVGLPNLEGTLFHAFLEVVHMVPQLGLELDPMGNVEQGQQQRVFCGFRQAQFQTEVAGLAFLVPDKHVARRSEALILKRQQIGQKGLWLQWVSRLTNPHSKETGARRSNNWRAMGLLSPCDRAEDASMRSMASSRVRMARAGRCGGGIQEIPGRVP